LSDKKSDKSAPKVRRRIRFPFGIKLALIVTLILLGSIWTITSLMAFMVSSEFVRTAGNTNFDINSRAASGIKERLYKIRSETLLFLDLTTAMEANDSQLRLIRNLFFERNPNIAVIIIPGIQENRNRLFFTHNEIPMEVFNACLAKEADAVERAKRGEPILRNVSPELGINILALFYPWYNMGTEETAIVFFIPENLSVSDFDLAVILGNMINNAS